MTTAERMVIDQLRDKGYVVVIWTPEELGGVEPPRVEDRVTELGNEVIECLKEQDAGE